MLVAAAPAASGFVAAATLRGYLTDRVDSQLASVARGQEHEFGGPGDGDEGPGHDGAGPRLPSAFVIQVLDGSGSPVGSPSYNFIDSGEPLPQFPHLTPAQAAAKHGHPFTVAAVSGSTQWRMRAVPVTASDGSSGTVLIAQSLADVQNTVGHLVTLLV